MTGLPFLRKLFPDFIKAMSQYNWHHYFSGRGIVRMWYNELGLQGSFPVVILMNLVI